MLNRFLVAFVACTAVFLIASSAHAVSLYIEYRPGPYVSTTTPEQIWTPGLWGWNDNLVGGTGTPIVNAANAQINAWRVTDSTPSTPNPRYISELISTSASAALSQGWKYTAYARYVTEGVTGNASGPNQGLSVNLGNRIYHLMLDLLPNGNLRASLFDDNLTFRRHQLTTNGVGATAFHHFELRYNPTTQLVELWFDEVLKDEWNGVALDHPDLISWGNHDQAGSGIGVMEFNEVKFEIGPFSIPGDYDANGIVNAADYNRWKSSFGSASNLSADGNGDRLVNAADYVFWRDRQTAINEAAWIMIPEPNGMLVIGTGILFLLRQRFRCYCERIGVSKR